MAETVTITDDRPEDPPAGDPGLETEAPGPEIPEDIPAPEAPFVEVAEIADALRAIGQTSHGLFGHPEVPDHWGFTEAEVSALAPPVTSIVNRHARARAIAQRSPELAVGMALGRWGIRNARLTAAIREAEAELAEQDEADETAEAPDSATHDDPGASGF